MSELVEPVVTLELHQISSRCRSSISDAERGQLVGSRAAMDRKPWRPCGRAGAEVQNAALVRAVSRCGWITGMGQDSAEH
jgi:hypothetical protein